MQKASQEGCENMLCYGHASPAGTLDATLTPDLQPVAEELAPFCWDPSGGRWLVLDSYPPKTSHALITLEDGQQPYRLTIQPAREERGVNLPATPLRLVSIAGEDDGVAGQLALRTFHCSLPNPI